MHKPATPPTRERAALPFRHMIRYACAHEVSLSTQVRATPLANTFRIVSHCIVAGRPLQRGRLGKAATAASCIAFFVTGAPIGPCGCGAAQKTSRKAQKPCILLQDICLLPWHAIDPHRLPRSPAV